MTPLVFPLFRDSNLIASALVVIAEIRKIKTLTSKCTKDQKNLEKKKIVKNGVEKIVRFSGLNRILGLNLLTGVHMM